MTDVGHTSPFQAMTPCRVLDTRNASGAFGGPKFLAGQTRTFTIPASSCAPPVAEAYSLNFTIIDFGYSGGFITAWPAGSAMPGTSTVTFSNSPLYAIANSAVIPANGSGSINIYASGATHVIVDINGYYTNEMTTNKQLFVPANMPGGAAIYGRNDSTTNGSHGVGGYATASTATVFGVQGGTAGASGSAGIHGYTAAVAGTAGVFGESPAISDSYGVLGTHTGTTSDAAGVLGWTYARVDTGTSSHYAAGVRGEDHYDYGVLGLTSDATFGYGVLGERWDGSPIARASAGALAHGTYGVYSWGNTGATGTKSFVDPHPTDASKVIRFVSVEGNQPTTFFRGRAKVSGGQAVILVPEEFRYVTEEDGLSVNVTPFGAVAILGVMSADLNQVIVQSNKDVEFSYVVYGIRKGYKDFQAIAEGNEFTPASANERMPAYLNENQKQSLISNGTYKTDGAVNVSTALRLGWDKLWAQERPANK